MRKKIFFLFSFFNQSDRLLNLRIFTNRFYSQENSKLISFFLQLFFLLIKKKKKKHRWIIRTFDSSISSNKNSSVITPCSLSFSMQPSNRKDVQQRKPNLFQFGSTHIWWIKLFSLSPQQTNNLYIHRCQFVN